MTRINFFGMDFALYEAAEIVSFFGLMDILSINDATFSSDIFRRVVSFSEKYDLKIGLPLLNEKIHPGTMKFRTFYLFHSNFYPVEWGYRKCSRCNTEFYAVNARVRDSYHGVDNLQEAYSWALNLPYIDYCPSCGYDENGRGQKFLAIFYEGNVISALDLIRNN